MNALACIIADMVVLEHALRGQKEIVLRRSEIARRGVRFESAQDLHTCLTEHFDGLALESVDPFSGEATWRLRKA